MCTYQKVFSLLCITYKLPYLSLISIFEIDEIAFFAQSSLNFQWNPVENKWKLYSVSPHQGFGDCLFWGGSASAAPAPALEDIAFLHIF